MIYNESYQNSAYASFFRGSLSHVNQLFIKIFSVVRKSLEPAEDLSCSIRRKWSNEIEALELNNWNYAMMPETQKNKGDFMIDLMKVNPVAYVFASAELQNDADFIIKAMKINPYAISSAGETLTNDDNFMLKAVKVNAYAVVFAKSFGSSVEFTRDAIEANSAVYHLLGDGENVSSAKKLYRQKLNYWEDLVFLASSYVRFLSQNANN